MNKLRLFLCAMILVVVILLSTILIAVDTPKRSATISLNAYELALKGDNSKLDDLNIDTDVALVVSNYKDKSGFSADWQRSAMDRAFDNVDISVVSARTISDGIIEVEYEITSLPVATLLQTILNDPEVYLSKESQNIRKNPSKATQLELTLLNDEAHDVYTQQILDMEFNTNTFFARIELNDDGVYVLNEDDLNLMISAVVELNTAVSGN